MKLRRKDIFPQFTVGQVPDGYAVLVAMISPASDLRAIQRIPEIQGRPNRFASEQQAEAFFRALICDKKDR